METRIATGETTPRRTTTSRRSAEDVGGNGRARQAARAVTGVPARIAPTSPRRIVIEGVTPEVDGGRFPAKCALGERAVVEADIYCDNHEVLAADVLYKRDGDADWTRSSMTALVNDRWRAEFLCSEMTPYVFTIEAWIDPFARWRDGLAKKAAAGQDVTVELLEGAALIEAAANRATGEEAESLRAIAANLSGRTAVARRVEAGLDDGLARRMRDLADRSTAARYERELRIKVDPPDALFSTWYEMFPRSASPDPARPGTFHDVEERLAYVEEMGFDVLYLPPIHPIGKSHRKGRNNKTEASEKDPGSPWAIGSEVGGHTAIDPALGTLDDFRRLVNKARERGIEIAMDIAFQCSPDHPWVREHPEWFRQRPDGTVQYAENPPKKYEDIYPLNFETDDWEALWAELRGVFLYWMEQGVRVFRVDNPHTKPFTFWEWVIAEIHAVDPTVILLSESFTRPKIMYHLAKLGFTQSYTYFAWRYSKWDLTQYFNELTTPPVADFFRPNAWPNTPDILTEQLQHGGRATFIARVVLAATLSASYGIYGPPFELMEHRPRERGSEEYLNSEKYEIRHWDIDRPDSLREIISLLNRARRDNRALQGNRSLRFHDTGNDHLIAYSKQSDDGENVVIAVVNLDPTHVQSGSLRLPIGDWGIEPNEPYQVHDLLSDARYTWQGESNFVQLAPDVVPAHVFRLRRRTGASGWEFE